MAKIRCKKQKFAVKQGKLELTSCQNCDKTSL